MKLYICADIEGVAGVVHPQHGQPGNPEYERARRLMTEEVNAAIDGAFAAGVSEVVVNDGHGPMVNLLPELLDPRADLILGKPKPANMLAGLDASFDGVFFTGFHTGAGRPGVLSHTVNGFAFRAVRLNGQACAEATLYGAYAGSLGVPILLLSGDDATVGECGAHFPGARVVTVKHALGQRAARAVSPVRARAMLREAAASIGRAEPFTIAGPYVLELELTSPALADLAVIIPVARRTSPTAITFDAATMADVVAWVNTVSALSTFLR